MRKRIIRRSIQSPYNDWIFEQVRVPVSFQQDNQAAITVIQSGYSAKLRHAGRVHRVNVTSIHEQLDQGVFDLDYCETTAQSEHSMMWAYTLSPLSLSEETVSLVFVHDVLILGVP